MQNDLKQNNVVFHLAKQEWKLMLHAFFIRTSSFLILLKLFFISGTVKTCNEMPHVMMRHVLTVVFQLKLAATSTSEAEPQLFLTCS